MPLCWNENVGICPLQRMEVGAAWYEKNRHVLVSILDDFAMFAYYEDRRKGVNYATRLSG